MVVLFSRQAHTDIGSNIVSDVKMGDKYYLHCPQCGEESVVT
jgi:phage terminase large subunit GpA-like protein